MKKKMDEEHHAHNMEAAKQLLEEISAPNAEAQKPNITYSDKPSTPPAGPELVVDTTEEKKQHAVDDKKSDPEGGTVAA